MDRDMGSARARSYTSPLRAEQAEQTRSRVVQGAVDLLAEGDAGDLSMADVAERAGVSVRTAYRHFASRDELLDGVITWLEERMTHRVGPRPATRAEYESTCPPVIDLVFEIEPLYRALFATRDGRESHRRSAAGRQHDINSAFGAEMAGLDDDAARRFGALIHLVSASNTALFMKDYWDLSPEDAGRAMQWAIRVLADAAGDPKRREGL